MALFTPQTLMLAVAAMEATLYWTVCGNQFEQLEGQKDTQTKAETSGLRDQDGFNQGGIWIKRPRKASDLHIDTQAKQKEEENSFSSWESFLIFMKQKKRDKSVCDSSLLGSMCVFKMKCYLHWA